jgi:hypothetical protein
LITCIASHIDVNTLVSPSLTSHRLSGIPNRGSSLHALPWDCGKVLALPTYDWLVERQSMSRSQPALDFSNHTRIVKVVVSYSL